MPPLAGHSNMWAGRELAITTRNSILAALTRQILNKSIAGEEMKVAWVEVTNGEYGYKVE